MAKIVFLSHHHTDEFFSIKRVLLQLFSYHTVISTNVQFPLYGKKCVTFHEKKNDIKKNNKARKKNNT